MSSGTGQGPALEKGTFRQFKHGEWNDLDDVVSPEHLVTLLWPGRDPVQLWAYPHDLEHLALGHAALELCPEECLPRILEQDGLEFRMEPAQACDQEPADAELAPLDGPTVRACMDEFIERGGKWDDTGCFHRMGIWDPAEETFLEIVEDIGRHNCIDRITGWCLAHKRNPGALWLFISARCTASLAAKITRAGFKGCVSRSAVTTAGIATAKAASMTLAGFARPNRFTVFTDTTSKILDPQK